MKEYGEERNRLAYESHRSQCECVSVGFFRNEFISGLEVYLYPELDCDEMEEVSHIP